MALLVSLSFFVLLASAIGLFGYRRYVLAGRMYQSLDALSPKTSTLGATNPDPSSFSRAAEMVAGKVPPSPETASTLHLKLLAAGYRAQNATKIFYGMKLIVMTGITLIMAVVELSGSGSPVMRILGVAVGLMAGYRLPDYVVAKRIRKRQKALERALPDALDLMVVCAEAGLTIDRSFKNVSQQLALMHPALCDEFNLFTAEITAGLRRKEALDNLALRTQEPEIKKLVAVLTQADRFGTGMADALRTHAEYLREKRRQNAEEKASKVSVKLIFPIFFFIMPCMMLVTIGPAAIAIVKHLGEMFGGGQ